MQSAIEQQSGVISGERTSGAIRAMHARSQADDEQPRVRIAERCDRAGMITRLLSAH